MIRAKFPKVSAAAAAFSGVLVSGVVALSTLGGCAGFTTQDPQQRMDFVFVNEPSVRAVMAEALRWTAPRFPPGTPAINAEAGQFAVGDSTERFAVSLPDGLTKNQHDAIIRRIGDNAVGVTDATRHLPTYRVGRVEVRAHQARVDIHRPLPPRADGTIEYQCMTIHLRGGMLPWSVERYEVWSPGVVPLPQLVYAPEAPPRFTDRPDRPTAPPAQAGADTEDAG